MTLLNAAPGPVGPLQVVLTLPSGVTFVGSAGPEIWISAVDGQTVTLGNPSHLAGGDTLQVRVVLSVDLSAETSSVAASVDSGPVIQAQLVVIGGGIPQVPVQLPHTHSPV